MKQVRKNQQGFSLVELMIAVTIGLLLVAAVLQMFLSMKKSYEFQEEFARLQENGRFAMEFLAKDIRNAGFWGCNGSGLGTIENHLASQAFASFGFNEDIDGTNGSEDGGTSALDAPDTIILRSAVDSGINVVDIPATTAANLKVTENSGLAIGDIVLLSDCTEGEIFQISNDPSTGGAPGEDIVVHNTGTITQGGTEYEPGNATKNFQKIYGTDAQIHKATSYEYSIANGAGGEMSLYRGTDELVEGVENMQILYGADTDVNKDGVPNFYAPEGHADLDMSDVVSVRISLLLVSLRDNLVTERQEPFAFNGGLFTPVDRRLRKVFSSEIALRNRLD